jgi:hypothetical protein
VVGVRKMVGRVAVRPRGFVLDVRHVLDRMQGGRRELVGDELARRVELGLVYVFVRRVLDLHGGRGGVELAPARWPEGLLLLAGDLGVVSPPAPLELQVLADRVVQQSHAFLAYSARTVLFFPARLAS